MLCIDDVWSDGSDVGVDPLDVARAGIRHRPRRVALTRTHLLTLA